LPGSDLPGSDLDAFASAIVRILGAACWRGLSGSAVRWTIMSFQVGYLGTDVEDALALAENTEI